MPTEIEITRAVTALTSGLGMSKAAREVKEKVIALLKRIIQAEGNYPASWSQLQDWVQEHAVAAEAALVLPALADCQKRRAYYPDLPGG